MIRRIGRGAGRWIRAVTSLGALAGLLAGANPAAAQAPEPASGRHAVILVEGPESEVVAAAIAAHVPPAYSVDDPGPFRAALAQTGARTFASAAGNRARSNQLVIRMRAAAAEAHVDTAIVVAIRKGRRGAQPHVWAVGDPALRTVVDRDLAASASALAEAEKVSAAVAPALPEPVHAAHDDEAKHATAPSMPAPADTVDPPAAAPVSLRAPDSTPDADRPVDAAGSARHDFPRATSLLAVRASVEAGSRHFAYTERVTPSLRPYDLFAAPLASIHAEAYPMARSRVPLVNGLGVVGGYTRAFALASADAGGTSVGTSWQAFDVAAHERVRVGASALLGVSVGYGGIDFRFDAPPTTAELPGVGYRFVRTGVDARGRLGAFSVFGAGNYLAVLSTGDIGQLFPREHVGGIEATLGGALQLSAAFELSVTADYSRFFHSMNPVPGDPNVAGGALDEIARLSLGLTYLL
jgi:hypothetical protein